jgi:hypothetical protein
MVLVMLRTRPCLAARPTIISLSAKLTIAGVTLGHNNKVFHAQMRSQTLYKGVVENLDPVHSGSAYTMLGETGFVMIFSDPIRPF